MRQRGSAAGRAPACGAISALEAIVAGLRAPSGRRVLADPPVGRFAQQVGVAGVPAVLLDQVAGSLRRLAWRPSGCAMCTDWPSPPFTRAALSLARDRSTALSHRS